MEIWYRKIEHCVTWALLPDRVVAAHPPAFTSPRSGCCRAPPRYPWQGRRGSPCRRRARRMRGPACEEEIVPGDRGLPLGPVRVDPVRNGDRRLRDDVGERDVSTSRADPSTTRERRRDGRWRDRCPGALPASHGSWPPSAACRRASPTGRSGSGGAVEFCVYDEVSRRSRRLPFDRARVHHRRGRRAGERAGCRQHDEHHRGRDRPFVVPSVCSRHGGTPRFVDPGIFSPRFLAEQPTRSPGRPVGCWWVGPAGAPRSRCAAGCPG